MCFTFQRVSSCSSLQVYQHHPRAVAFKYCNQRTILSPGSTVRLPALHLLKNCPFVLKTRAMYFQRKAVTVKTALLFTCFGLLKSHQQEKPRNSRNIKSITMPLETYCWTSLEVYGSLALGLSASWLLATYGTPFWTM